MAASYLWAENRLGQMLQAYQTKTSQLYYVADPTLPGYVTYAAPWKGLIYDSGVSGAVVMNVASGAGFTTYPLTRASGMHVDYANARVILPSSFGSNLVLTGTYSFKEVNTYQAQENEEGILTQGKYFVNPKYIYLANSGVPPYVPATPAVFINNLDMNNEAYQFGGLVNSKTTISLTVLAESTFQLTAILSAFKDARYSYYPLIGIADDPIDGWGDTKSGYNYLSYVQRFGTPGNLVFIENVHTSKVSDKAQLSPRQFAGIIDLDVSYIRQSPNSVS